MSALLLASEWNGQSTKRLTELPLNNPAAIRMEFTSSVKTHQKNADSCIEPESKRKFVPKNGRLQAFSSWSREARLEAYF